jgi:hypothetical protein
MMDLAARLQYRMRAAVEYNRQMVGLFLQRLAMSFQRNNIDESARASLAGFNPSLSNKTRNAALANRQIACGDSASGSSSMISIAADIPGPSLREAHLLHRLV